MRVGFKSIACNLANILLTRLVGERQVLEIATFATRIQVARIVVAQHIEMRDSAQFEAVFAIALTALVNATTGDLRVIWRTDSSSSSAGRCGCSGCGSRCGCTSCGGRASRPRRPRRPRRGSRPRCSRRTSGRAKVAFIIRTQARLTRDAVAEESSEKPSRICAKSRLRRRARYLKPVALFLRQAGGARFVDEHTAVKAPLAARAKIARIVVARRIEMGDSTQFETVFAVALCALVGTAAGNLRVIWRTDGAGRAGRCSCTSRGRRRGCARTPCRSRTPC